jgi:hypothetical protein
MCFATTDEAMGNMFFSRNSRKTECGSKQFPTPVAVRAAPFALSSSFFRLDDLKVRLQELPVGKFVDAEFGGNFHAHIL